MSILKGHYTKLQPCLLINDFEPLLCGLFCNIMNLENVIQDVLVNMFQLNSGQYIINTFM